MQLPLDPKTKEKQTSRGSSFCSDISMASENCFQMFSSLSCDLLPRLTVEGRLDLFRKSKVQNKVRHDWTRLTAKFGVDSSVGSGSVPST